MCNRALRRLAVCVLILDCTLVATSSMAAQTAATAPAASIGLDSLYNGFVGDWVGQLEYRDYGDNSRVFLPTWLAISRSADGRSLRFAYTYDDGPNKTVKEVSLLVLDAAAGTATFTSESDHSGTKYRAAGLAEFSGNGTGKLILTGSGTDNDKKVDVRITMALRRNLYTYVKETKLPGQEFLFRDGYTFTRKQAPE